MFIGIDTNLLKMLSAIIVALFLAIPYVKSTYFAKKPKPGAAASAEEGEDKNA